MVLNTFTGRTIAPLAPRAGDIVLEDIAHALSHQCRFAGHVRQFYSVAQHSVLVSRAMPAPLALWGLLHDASEAYIVDVPTPLKRTAALEGYRAVEALHQRTIYAAFGLTGEEPSELAEADRALLVLEARALFPEASAARITEGCDGLALPPFSIQPWTSMAAKVAFQKRFTELTGREA